MRKMTIDQINDHTLSGHVTTKLCVYMASRDSIGLMDSDGDETTIGDDFIDIPKGTLLARYGCGPLNKKGPTSTFVHRFDDGRDIAIHVNNVDVIHYANPIMDEVPPEYEASNDFIIEEDGPIDRS